MKVCNRKRKNKVRESSVIERIILVFLLIYALSLLFPIFWAFITSLKDQLEYTTYNINGLPEKWLFSNYAESLKVLNIDGNNYLTMLFNSIWYSTIGVIFGVLAGSMVAYVVAKYEFPGREAVYYTAIIIMMIPIIGTSASLYKVYQFLGVIDTPFILISQIGGLGSGFLIMYSYYKNLSWNFAEAAFIDGANNVQVFFKVMMPQSITPMFSLAILGFIGLWNDTNNPLLYMKSYPTLASGLFMFQMITTRKLNMPVLYAGLLLSMIPVLIIYIAFSEKIMSLSIGGGLKG